MRLRETAFAVAVLVATVFVAFTQWGTWRQSARLERQVAAVQFDSFHLADRVALAVAEMNDVLLRIELHNEPSDLESFQEQVAGLRRWLSEHGTVLFTELERELMARIEGAGGIYLTAAHRLIEETLRPAGNDELPGLIDRLEQESGTVLALCRELRAAQVASLQLFLSETHDALGWLQRLLMVSQALLVTSSVTVAVLIYRWMIAPLRSELSESHAVIERQEKLASLGVLAAGVAHEVRNPLTAIKFRLFSLKRCLEPASSEAEDAGVIGHEIERLERIVKEFLQFARPSNPEWKETTVMAVVEPVVALLEPELSKRGIGLRLDVPELSVQVDPQQIQQVLINLVQNAGESIGRDGSIAIRVRSDTQVVRGQTTRATVWEVIDSGKGIPPEVQRRLFDPFFTTKEGGSGLGLSVAARIVEKHGGELRYQTQPQRGTTFSLVIPFEFKGPKTLHEECHARPFTLD
jgi:signal transduction histidine kinase